MKIANNVLELIGNTPIVTINKLTGDDSAMIYAKLENYNPGGSIKDRIALNMIEGLEKKNILKPGDVLVEPTSGNTGIGICMVGAVKGYKVVIVMPEHMSDERKKMMKAYGAKLVLTPREKGMDGAIEEANRLVSENPNYHMLSQFENPDNPSAHEKTTALEIIDQVGINVDCIIAGVGTGGTITGIARYIKKMNPSVKIIAVEPAGSPVLSGGNPGPHGLQGLGAGFIPKVYEKELIDEIIPVSDENAKSTAREAVCKEGIFLGISAGAALYAALVKGKELGKNKKIVVIFPDSGDKYLSTDLFDI